MYSRPEHAAHFRTLEALRPPVVGRAVAWMILVGLAVTAAILFGVPWVQTAPGTGQVIALNPEERLQTVTALVPGRVEAWYVTDGQRVRAGDPIARIIDNDPNLLDRLRGERAQNKAEIAAATASIAAIENSIAVAQLDVNRTRALYAEGLVARRDYELAQIKVADGRTKLAEARAKLAESRAKLNRIDVSLNRQSAQIVRAPRDGRIQEVAGSTAGTLVSAGQALASLAPETPQRVIELMIDGRDIALIKPGRRVRLEFEGWPAIQISGWPGASTGLFDGRVRSIDAASQASGLFRVLVEEAPGKPRWPGPQYIRLGAKAQGWIQMETVSVGYELWRQLNDFPLEFGPGGSGKAAPSGFGKDSGAAKKGGDSSKDGGDEGGKKG